MKLCYIHKYNKQIRNRNKKHLSSIKNSSSKLEKKLILMKYVPIHINKSDGAYTHIDVTKAYQYYEIKKKNQLWYNL